jgi:hypothetical protein
MRGQPALPGQPPQVNTRSPPEGRRRRIRSRRPCGMPRLKLPVRPTRRDHQTVGSGRRSRPMSIDANGRLRGLFVGRASHHANRFGHVVGGPLPTSGPPSATLDRIRDLLANVIATWPPAQRTSPSNGHPRQRNATGDGPPPYRPAPPPQRGPGGRPRKMRWTERCTMRTGPQSSPAAGWLSVGLAYATAAAAVRADPADLDTPGRAVRADRSRRVRKRGAFCLQDTELRPARYGSISLQMRKKIACWSWTDLLPASHRAS